MIDLTKAGQISGMPPEEADLEQINQFAITPLAAEDVFTYKVIACGNEIDRDLEAFTTAALETLAQLYVGKTMICNHDARAQNQMARIYRTEVVPAEGVSKIGEPRANLVAWCYMVKTEGNHDFIREIQAGIKREVSVGCSVGKTSCSVCGANANACTHRPGMDYGGTYCYIKLEDPKDAYELSFVAVPAQPNAGVTKSRRNAPETYTNTVLDKLRAAFKEEKQ